MVLTVDWPRCSLSWICSTVREHVVAGVHESRMNLVTSTFREGGIAMQAQNSLVHRGAVMMVVGAAIFLIYAIVFFFRAFSGDGFELGVATSNSVTQAQLNQLNPAITAYIAHVHVALAGFIAATAIAVIGLTWYGVRAGAWWAWITAVISPVVGLAVGVPMHYMGRFEWDWVAHLGPVYLGTLIFVVGAVMALVGMMRKAPATA